MPGLAVKDFGRRRGQPSMDHPQRAPVRFVAAGRLMTATGQSGQLVAHRDEPRRHRQVLLQRGDFDEVMPQRGVGRPSGGQAHHLGGDIGVPVAIAADPRSGPQNRFVQQVRVWPAGLQRHPNLRVDLRYDVEKRGRVIPQAGFNLVLNLQPRQPDQRGLPQRDDVAAQFAFDVTAVSGLGVAVQAQPHQLGDPVLGVEHGAAPSFRGVRSDHRGHQRPGQCVGHRHRIQLGGVELHERGGQAAVLRRLPGPDVDGPPSLSVNVLRNVGQQREVGKGADHRDGLMDIDPVEQGGQLGTFDLGAAHPKRFHPGPLDQVEDRFAVLLADRVTQYRTQQPDVVPHRFGRFGLHHRLPCVA